MYIEHIVYSSALAILVGMVFYQYTGRDHSWIIIICAYAPDVDHIIKPILSRLGIGFTLHGSPIHNGTIHNIGIMVFFSIAMALVLLPLGIQIFDSLFFSLIGFGSHLFEDALMYTPGYPLLWPFSSDKLGAGLLTNIAHEDLYIRDFFGIANSEVFIIGLLLLLAAIIIRTYYERSSSWIRWYMPEKIYLKLTGQTSRDERGTGDHRVR